MLDARLGPLSISWTADRALAVDEWMRRRNDKHSGELVSVIVDAPAPELDVDVVQGYKLGRGDTWVRKVIGPTATPDHLQWAPGLPKTRSGKIMRRILRKIAENAPDQLGDTSTLADPGVVDSLVNERKVQ